MNVLRLSGALILSILTSTIVHASATELLRPDFFPGWDSTNVFHPFIVHDSGASNGTYKMYYTASGRNDFNAATWGHWVTGLATSENGISWKRNDVDFKPTIKPGEYNAGDLLDPAIQLTVFDSMWIIDACVIKDGAVYKMWYTGWNGASEHLGNGIRKKVDFRIGYATSTDGFKWTKQSGTAGAGSILGLGSTGQPDVKGTADPCVLKEGGTYRMWYEGFDGTTWRICYATSTDGINWTKQGLVLDKGTGGALDGLGVRHPVVITRSGQYELWYEGKSSSSPNYHIMRAVSADGNSWTKVTGEVSLNPVIPAGETTSAFNGDEDIIIGNITVNPDNTCQVYFSKQVTKTISATFGSFTIKSFRIYVEVVNP